MKAAFAWCEGGFVGHQSGCCSRSFGHQGTFGRVAGGVYLGFHFSDQSSGSGRVLTLPSVKATLVRRPCRLVATTAIPSPAVSLAALPVGKYSGALLLTRVSRQRASKSIGIRPLLTFCSRQKFTPVS